MTPRSSHVTFADISRTPYLAVTCYWPSSEILWRGKDDDGAAPINPPEDFVRIEIESALERGIPVVPILVGKAQMPSADELPQRMRDMAYRQAAEIGFFMGDI